MATEYSRAAVHLAAGVLMERHNCDAARAIALLSSSAFNAGRTITDLAREVIDDHHQCLVTGDQGPGCLRRISRRGRRRGGHDGRVNDEWVTILFTHVWDHVEQLPPAEQQEARELIAAQRWRIGNEIVDDVSDPLWGLTYVVDLLPEDRDPWRVAQVASTALMAYPDPEMVEALGESPPDDPSSLTEPPT